jgi:uncharacterized protein (DUF1015 family)
MAARKRQEQPAVVDAAPFRAVRYDPRVAGSPAATSAPAYDHMRRFTYAEHRAASPYTVLELLTRRGGGYDHAAQTLRRWQRTGVLRADDDPAFFRYDVIEGGHAQRGVLAAVRLEPLGGSVLPHEEVDAARVAVRLDRFRAAPIDVTPIVALVHGAPAWHAPLEREPAAPPIVDFADEEGVRHRIWTVGDPAEQENLRSALKAARVVIADGHHRYAAALAYHAATGAPAAERTLMYLVDERVNAPRIRPVHRLVGRLPDQALDRLNADFHLDEATLDVEGLAGAVARSATTVFGLRLADRGRLLVPRDLPGLRRRLPASRPQRWQEVDAALLEHAVLQRLGVAAAEVEPVGDLQTAAARVAAGEADALFLLRPVDVETVVALALEGKPMPPKSTWFRPKPRAGLVMRALEDAPLP